LNLRDTGWGLLPIFQIDHVGHNVPPKTRGAGIVRRSEPRSMRAGTLSRRRVRLVGQVYDFVHVRGSGRHDWTSIIESVTRIPPWLEKLMWEKRRVGGMEGLPLMVPRRLVPIREVGHFTMRSLSRPSGQELNAGIVIHSRYHSTSEWQTE